MVHVRDLKFHVCIAHEKIVDPYFFLVRVMPLFRVISLLKQNLKNLVCKISQKVFKLEPSYLIYWLELMSR